MEESKKKKRKFRRQDEILILLEQFRKSGKTKTEFCKEQSISYSALLKWINKSEFQGSIPQGSGKLKQDFIPVGFGGSVSTLFEIIYPNGCRINFYSQVDAQLIKTLLG